MRLLEWIVLALGIAFCAGLSCLYLADPIRAFNRLLQPGFGGTQPLDNTKRAFGIVMGLLSAAMTLLLVVVALAKLLWFTKS